MALRMRPKIQLLNDGCSANEGVPIGTSHEFEKKLGEHQPAACEPRLHASILGHDIESVPLWPSYAKPPPCDMGLPWYQSQLSLFVARKSFSPAVRVGLIYGQLGSC